MWSKGLALRLAPEGIAVFDVRPGHHPHRHDGRRSPTAYDAQDRRRPGPGPALGRGADVGRVVAALAGGDFGFATGSVIDVDGGLGIPRL